MQKIFWESISHPREKINLAVYYRKKVVAVIVKELYNLTEILLFTLRRLRAKFFFFIECSIPSQEINRVFLISRCYILIWANTAIPSRKYSIKEPAKSRNSVLFMSLERSKWFGPFIFPHTFFAFKNWNAQI